MTEKLKDYEVHERDVDSFAKQVELLELPLETSNLAILPWNAETARSREELTYCSNASTVRKLFEKQGLQVSKLEKIGERWPSKFEHDNFWVAPLLFFTGAMVAENPAIINIAYGVIANHVSSLFVTGDSSAKVKAKVILKKTKTTQYLEFDYEGSPEDLILFAEQLTRKVISDEKAD